LGIIVMTYQLIPLVKTVFQRKVDEQLNKIFIQVFNEHLASDIQDILSLATPEKGSMALLRKSLNNNGFAILENVNTDAYPNYESNLRLVFKMWLGLNYNGRGLAFLEALVSTMYPTGSSVRQLWQPKSEAYGTGLFTIDENPDISDAWLTSRVRITLSTSESLATLQGMVAYTIPARFVVEYNIV